MSHPIVSPQNLLSISFTLVLIGCAVNGGDHSGESDMRVDGAGGASNARSELGFTAPGEVRAQRSDTARVQNND